MATTIGSVTGVLTDEQKKVLDQITADRKNQEKLKSQSLDQDAFLKILMTQIQHQDPTSPLQDKDMMAQMAQFSSVEQISGVNAKMTANNSKLDDMTTVLAKMNETMIAISKNIGTSEGSEGSSSNTEILNELKKINESISKLSVQQSN